MKELSQSFYQNIYNTLKKRDAIKLPLDENIDHSKLPDMYCTFQNVIKCKDFKASAVLLPLFFKKNQAHILLIKRTEKLEHHKGEISFPGGAREEQDQNLKYTAVRETEEEIGVEHSKIHILGVLDEVFTIVSSFIVTPYVGIIPYPYNFKLNYTEAERILEIPLSFFQNKDNYWEDTFSHENHKYKSPFFKWKNDIIWGVTASIILNFCSVIAPYTNDTVTNYEDNKNLLNYGHSNL